MNIAQKMMGRSVETEQEYFDSLKASVTHDGALISLGQLLERSNKLFPDNVALLWHDKQMIYKELYFRAGLLSVFLAQKGIKPRDRVLVYFDNSLEFYIAYFGIVQLGAVVAPLNTFLHETELRHIFNDAKPTCVITHSSHIPLWQTIQADQSALILTETVLDLTTPVPTTMPLFPVYRLDEHEMAALLYTSGTTGMPKGVMLSSKNIITNVMQALARLKLSQSKVILGVLPLFHSFSQSACVWATLFSGCSVIIVPKVERRYILEGLHHKPTIILGVPALFGLFCLLRAAPFDQVDYFVSGGDALPDKIRAAFELIYRRKICNGYGMTETTPMISVDLDDALEPTSCVGRPLLGIQCKVIDEHGNAVSQGEIGQLLFKGDNVMLGYYNAPQMTEQTIKDGWLYSGDLGYIDERGKIVITGRSKDLIIHKGFNIYPQEIENVLLSYPTVIRAGVVGKSDNASGEVPIAFVQVRTMEHDIEKKLKELCTKQLAMYKVPKEFFVSTQDLPTTATGKVDKKILRKKA